MERTYKPWENQSTSSAKHIVPHNKAHSSAKSDATFESEDIRKLVQTFSHLPESKRNRQRDAYRPTSVTFSPRISLGPGLSHLKSDRGDFRRAKSSENSVMHTIQDNISADQQRIPVSFRHSPMAASTSSQCLTDCEASLTSDGVPTGLVDSSPPPAYDDTDWGRFRARIAAAPTSATYEDLLLLEEFNGPASPLIQSAEGERIFNVSVALVEIINRRKNKEGKAKLKLAVAGTRVDKCGICLTQFRGEERAALTDCRHCFHELCLQRWMTRVTLCPLCRVELRSEAPSNITS
ncbi:hypothetical protein CPB86DRAFT_744441 [Serendipita vermifera]|nr:hypothetical protein CPB86DRAFT_744441 [Serendipita vermifera]